MRFTAAALVVLALSLAAYSDSFRASFHFDDYHQVVDNQNMRSLRGAPAFFSDSGKASYDERVRTYRPVLFTTFALNYALSAYKVWGYHAVNFALHFLDSLLVLLVVRAVLIYGGRPRPLLPALATSLLFAVHPVQTGAVTYISGRSALLFTFFSLASLLCFILYRESPPGKARSVCGALSPVLFLLGLFSKETAVATGALILLYDLIFTLPRRRAAPLKPALYYVPFIVCLGAYLAARSATRTLPPGGAVTAGQYLLSEARVFLLYLRLLVLPVNLNLDYNLPVAKAPDAWAVASVLLVALIVFSLFRVRKKDPAVTFFGGWFLLALAPESTFVPIADLAVEYRLYLPSAGFIAAAVLLASGLIGLHGLKRTAVAGLALMLAGLTYTRNLTFADEITVWSDVARKAPYSSRAHFSLGGALMGEGRYSDAVEELERGILLEPDPLKDRRAYVALGQCYRGQGYADRAIGAYKKALELDPDSLDAMQNLGDLYNMRGEYESAVEVLSRAILINPGCAPAHFNLALSYMETGRPKEALGEMELAYQYNPMDFQTAYRLAEAYKKNGMRADAAKTGGLARELAADPIQKNIADTFLAGL